MYDRRKGCFMRRRFPPAVIRKRLNLEPLEDRQLLSGFTVALDPTRDQTGNQILTYQAYNDPSITAMSFFDTGSSAITFSMADQSRFTSMGNPIPIKVPGGGVAE